MAQAIIQQQPVDGDFNDAVDPESDILVFKGYHKVKYDIFY
jgi:hypothetical protein